MIIALAARNATRNLQRTFLTAGTVVFGTALITVFLCWMDGIFGTLTELGAASIGQVRVVAPEYARREDLMPIDENFADVDPIVERVRKADGVTGAYPRIVTGATMTTNGELGDVFGLVVGAPIEWYTKELSIQQYVVAGRFLETDKDIVIGGSLADQLNAKVGDTIVVFGQTQDGSMSAVKGEIVGMVRANNAVFDQQVYLTLPKAQYFADMDGGATEILVYGVDRDDAPELAEAVRGQLTDLGDTALVQAWIEREPWAGILGIAMWIRSMLTGAIVLVTALGVWNTMMMSVLERTNEIGVLRAMGLSRLGAVSLFVIEAIAIATLGGLVGVTIGSIGGYILEVRGIDLGAGVVQNVNIPFSAHMHGDLTVRVVVIAFCLGIVMAFLGSFPSALRAASIQPVVAMRARR